MDHAQCQILPDRRSGALAAPAGNLHGQSHIHDAPRVQPTKDSESSRLTSKTSDCGSDVSARKTSRSSSNADSDHPKRKDIQQPQLLHLNALSAPVTNRIPHSTSQQTSEPVLVHANPKSNHRRLSNKVDMRARRRGQPTPDSKDLPGPENFTFQDIFASLDSDVKKSVDTIAEIYGRSNMSLADEHANHLPPQANLDISSIHSMTVDAPELVNTHRLEPVQETPDHDRRRHCLDLTSSTRHNQYELSSVPLATTSMAVTYRSFPSPLPSQGNRPVDDVPASDETRPSSVGQIVTWLRQLNSKQDDCPQSKATATDSLRRALGEA